MERCIEIRLPSEYPASVPDKLRYPEGLVDCGAEPVRIHSSRALITAVVDQYRVMRTFRRRVRL